MNPEHDRVHLDMEETRRKEIEAEREQKLADLHAHEGGKRRRNPESETRKKLKELGL